MKYRLTKAARKDLLAIRRYTINNFGIEQADSYLNSMYECFNLIAANPMIGVTKNDILPGALSFQHESHFIYYVLSADEIVFFGVLHKSILPASDLVKRDFV